MSRFNIPPMIVAPTPPASSAPALRTASVEDGKYFVTEKVISPPVTDPGVMKAFKGADLFSFSTILRSLATAGFTTVTRISAI
jgi:hypothetical protein